MATKYAPRTQTAATARAKSFDGKAYPKGRCQAFVVVEVFGTGAVGDYDGDKAADAEDGWKKAVDHGTVVKIPAGLSAAARAAWIKNIPAGYMAYYTGGSADNGHAATTLGAGKLFTTDKTPGVCGIVDVTWPETHWGLKFVGYATKDGNGFTLTDRASSVAKAPVAVWGKPETFVLGSTGADVARLGARLVIWAKALKLPAPYRSGPGSPLTATDVAAVKAFQKAQGWSGADADGYPGVETFKRLAADPKPTTDPEPPVKPTDTLTILTNNLWGYGKAESSSTQTVRLPRFVALVKKHMPDHVCVQELSNQTADKKVQRGDTEAKTPFEYVMDNLHDLGYAYDSIGSDGRYIFRLKTEVQFIKGKTILMTPEYEGDDKQAALGVYKKGARTYSLDSAHTENEGVDDRYRVGQTKSLLKQVYDFAKPLGVDTRWQFHAGDFNDHDAVLAAFKERGFVDAFARAPLAHRIKAAVQSFGTYLKILAGKRIDLVTVYKDITVLRAEQITDPTYDDSDHKAQLVEIQL